METRLVVEGVSNKVFVRDLLITGVTLQKRCHKSFTMMDLIFNKNALDIQSQGKGSYYLKMDNVLGRSILEDILKESLIHDEIKDYASLQLKDAVFQNLFLKWQGVMF